MADYKRENDNSRISGYIQIILRVLLVIMIFTDKNIANASQTRIEYKKEETSTTKQDTGKINPKKLLELDKSPYILGPGDILNF